MRSDFQAALSDTPSLSEARREFAQLVKDSEAATNPPAAISGDVQALVSDIGKFNTWLDTQATQADLSGSKVPSAIATTFSDLRTRADAVDSWTKAHCH